MVKPLNAAIADSAVDCSWWPVDVTSDAVFDLGQPCVDDIQVFAPLLDVYLVNLALVGFQKKVSHRNGSWVLCGRQDQKDTCSQLHDQTKEKEDPG
jgi:hypothetical protein